MRRTAGRALALAALAGGAAAAYVAVVDALGTPGPGPQAAEAADTTLASRTVVFPGARVVVRAGGEGGACYRVVLGPSTAARACTTRLAPDEVSVAVSRTTVGGLAGARVRAVIVKLTRKGTTWATLRHGAFVAHLPKAHTARAVVKVLRDGTHVRIALRAGR